MTILSYLTRSSSIVRSRAFLDDRGLTLVELMMAIVIMALIGLVASAYVQVGIASNARVQGDAAFTQEFSLAFNQVLDGAGASYRGLRAASSVTPAEINGITYYQLYFGEPYWAEQYWVSDGFLYRSLADGLGSCMIACEGISIVQTESSSALYDFSLISPEAEAGSGRMTTRVRLRNVVD
jgi:prepilin-type N-terminal cleavage/methylation domain-containing protein